MDEAGHVDLGSKAWARRPFRRTLQVPAQVAVKAERMAESSLQCAHHPASSVRVSTHLCMYVDFISAVSAHAIDNPGVTWDLYQNLQVSNVSIL
jgi:hypothetical protein